MATVRHGKHKLIRLDDFGEVVYGTSAGMMDEEKDLLATGTKSLHDSLRQTLQNWEAELMDPIWIEGEDWNKVTRHIYERLMGNEAVLAKRPAQLGRLK